MDSGIAVEAELASGLAAEARRHGQVCHGKDRLAPLVSVVLTTYNRCTLLKRSLPLLLSQDFPPDRYELIIVDDGSSDGTREHLGNLVASCGLKVIHQRNRGAAAARNAGLRLARGSLVLLMDDDLLCPPDLLRRHAAAHEERPGCVVYGATETAADSPRSLASSLTRRSSREATSRLQRDRDRPGREIALDPNCSIALGLLAAAGGFDETFGNSRETSEIAMRLRTQGVPFRYIEDAAVAEVYVKSSRRLGRDDALAGGAGEVRLRRKHSPYRPESVLANLSEGGILRRFARRGAATLPGADLLVSLPLQACEALSGFGLAERAGLRLLQWRQGINLYRGALAEAGGWPALAREFGARVPCLIYHHVGPRRPGTYPDLTVLPERFEAHLRWLHEWGYETITPTQWVRWRTGDGQLPERPVLLTFDDAYADAAEHAFPLLEKHGMTAAVFAVAGELGGSNSWDERLGCGTQRLMDAEQLRHWSRRGFEVGAHSMTHADLTLLDAKEIHRELQSSRRILSDLLSREVTLFAYPYGYFDERSENAARMHYELAFTTTEGLNTLATGPHRLRRTMVLPGDRRADFFSRLRLGYSFRHRWVSRLASLSARFRRAHRATHAAPGIHA